MTSLSIELIPDLEEGGFTARVPDIPAYGEGETEEAAIEAFGLEDAMARLVQPVLLRQTEWDLGLLAHG